MNRNSIIADWELPDISGKKTISCFVNLFAGNLLWNAAPSKPVEQYYNVCSSSFICPFVHTPNHPPIHSSIHPSTHPSIHPSIHLSIHPFVKIQKCTLTTPTTFHSPGGRSGSISESLSLENPSSVRTGIWCPLLGDPCWVNYKYNIHQNYTYVT